MKRIYTTLLAVAIAAVSAVSAATYPDKMYIKGDWDNNSNWVWHTMTTVADGIYTYNAYWNSLYGCNINTSKSDSGSAWYKYNKIVGYDPDVLTYGRAIVLTYSASGEMLYVAPSDIASVALLFPTPELHTGQAITLSARTLNIASPSYTYSLTDSEGNPVSISGATVTIDSPGSYTFSVTAKGTDGSEAVCSVTKEVTEYIAPEPCPFTPTADELSRAYHEDPATHDITFVFDPATWGKSYSSLKTVHVSGSFNGWSGSGNDDFKLRQDPDRQILYLTVPYNTVKRPGNIGQPEFKFVIDGNYANPYSSYPSDYIYNSNGNKNMIVVFSFDNLSEIRATISGASVISKVSDYDLTTRAGQEAISNYRTVPGTTMLMRCYHPFKTTSRTSMSTEPVRLQYLSALAVADGVKSDICLSGDDTGSLGTYTADGTQYTEAIPQWYQTALDGGHVLYVGAGYATPSYNEVYYNIRSANFGRWIKDVVDFVNDPANEAPFTIHCRLGTDRTGVFCATLAALCGASWDEVVADYQLSNRMGINEYRSHKLLKYAFEDLLGVTDIAEVADFSAAVIDNLIGKGVISADEIETLRCKLNNIEISGIDTVVEDIDDASRAEATPYYDLTGRAVTHPSRGFYIHGGRKVYVR